MRRRPCQNVTVTDLDSFLASFDGEPGYLDWAAFGPLSPAVRSEVHADAELLGLGPAHRASTSSASTSARRASCSPSCSDADAAQVVAAAVDDLRAHAGDLRARRRAHALARASSRASPSPRRAPRTRSARSTCSGSSPTDGFVTPDVVREALTDDTRALAVSLVDFRTGYRADLDRTARGHRRPAADRRCDPGLRRRRRRLRGRRRRLRQRLQVAARRPGHRVRVVRRARARAHRAGPVRVRRAPTATCRSTSSPRPAASAQAFTVSRPDTLAAARLATALREVRDVGVDDDRGRAVGAHARRDLLRRPLRGAGPHAARARSAAAGIVTLAPGAAGRRPARGVARQPRDHRHGPLAASSGSRRTSAPAPTRCACSATRWPRSRPLACGDARVVREFTRP